MSTTLDVGGVKFNGAYIAVVFAFISTIAGAIWTASSVYSRLEVVEAYEIPEISPIEERLAVMEKELEANDISQLQGKLATFGTNLATIMEQQTKLLAIQERIVQVEKEMEAMKGIVQRAEIKTKELEGIDTNMKNIKREITELWEGMDYLSNPLK
jgi:hypothetical protein